jgi:hypothetical protein
MSAKSVNSILSQSGIALDGCDVGVAASSLPMPSESAVLQSSKRDADLIELLAVAAKTYTLRAFDNVDPSRLTNLSDKVRVVAEALMERGDARAYALARRMLAAAGERSSMENTWRKMIRQSLDDPRPSIPARQVFEDLCARRAALMKAG